MSSKFLKNVESLRPRLPDIRPRTDALLSPLAVGRRQSKGGLRDLFSKNRSTRTLAATSEQDETATIRSTSTASGDNNGPPWGPPPLFQAYPQSIKHAKLDASNVSAPTILRLNEQQSANVNGDDQQSSQDAAAAGSPGNSIAQRTLAIIAQAGWTRKIYVLTTTGHLLQYAGEGAFDRKPEKVLQLGKDSAAFASDAIQGRPYVLHVSQSSNEEMDQGHDGHRGIFSRIGIRNLSARRTTSVLLLVFEAPDQLESWLSTIRKAIGNLGGPMYGAETSIDHNQNMPSRVFSHRFGVPKHPTHLSSDTSPTDPRELTSEQRSSTHSSTYTATDLERLRDSKTSNATTLQGTATSSLESPPPSPGRDKLGSMEAPYLMLPELESPSPARVSPRRKQRSRFSLPFSEASRRGPADVKSIAHLARQKSVQTRSGAAAMSVSGIDGISGAKKARDGDGDREKSDDHKGDLLSEPTSRTGVHPDSMIRPLATPHSGSGAPEPSTGSKYSLFPTSSEGSGPVPKRYSSLEYSRARMQPRPPAVTSSVASDSQEDARRPNSMRLRREPSAPAKRPPWPPKALELGSETAESETGANPKNSLRSTCIELAPTTAESSFGPPACPPPSGPLPALPARKPFSRRQRSLRAR